MRGQHALAAAIAQRRRLHLVPGAGESAASFARRVFDDVAERLYDVVGGPLSEAVDGLYYGMNLPRDTKALSATVVDFVGLVTDVVALARLVSDEESTS